LGVLRHSRGITDGFILYDFCLFSGAFSDFIDRHYLVTIPKGWKTAEAKYLPALEAKDRKLEVFRQKLQEAGINASL
jgi:hypothetical protein